MNIYDYIAQSNPNEANVLLSKYGLDNTNDYVLISDRLKAIVRRDKSLALEEIVKIHPDKDLISQFNPRVEEEFLNITGRTPAFDNSSQMFANEDAMFDNSSAILDNQMIPETPTPIVVAPPVIPPDNQEVKLAIKELKNENKREREKIKVDKRNRTKMAQLSQTSLLMCVVAFAIGYMIGNKK